MRKILMMFALLTGFMAAYAQQSGGDYFEGLSRKIGFSRMIPPHGLEITYDKTVHVIFPSPIKYVDLGSTNLIAGKADGAENVIRVKAARKQFRNETNMSVITEDGNFTPSMSSMPMNRCCLMWRCVILFMTGRQ